MIFHLFFDLKILNLLLFYVFDCKFKSKIPTLFLNTLKIKSKHIVF